MGGLELMILPFGILPIVLIVVYIAFRSADDKFQKSFLSTFIQGITEYPLEISVCRWGSTIAFTEDGKSVTVTADYVSEKMVDNPELLREQIKNSIGESQGFIDRDRVDDYIIMVDNYEPEKETCRLTVTLPDEIVQSEAYIRHEIRVLGCVFEVNHVNNARYINYPQKQQSCIFKEGKIFVHIQRLQLLPHNSLFRSHMIMSEKQIKRNIKNRLWNRVDVKTISMDDFNFHGEIILL